MAVSRVVHEPAFVLHSLDWSESSAILDVLTRHHGRVPLVAKGAKRPHSNLRAILLPFQPLVITYSGDGEVRTLKAAEWAGGHAMLTGARVMSAYYLNELLVKLLAREDAHPDLFDAYAQALALLAALQDGPDLGLALASALRAFEIRLLGALGVVAAWGVETASLVPVRADAAYAVDAEDGLREAGVAERLPVLGGSALLAAHAAGQGPLHELAHAVAPHEARWRAVLRDLLAYHAGGSFRTRALMHELQAL
jgi:DNA repair protein RecO (recombination protein O)